MTMLMNWPLLLLVSLSAVGPIVAVVLMYRLTVRLMRIFSEKQGIPSESMEPKQELVAPKPPAKKRVMMSVPLPGAQLFRKVENGK